MRIKKNVKAIQKIKNLNVFLKINKKKHLLIKNAVGIRFLIEFRKNLDRLHPIFRPKCRDNFTGSC